MILTIRTDKPEAEIGLYDTSGKQQAHQTWQAHRQLAETIHVQIQELLKEQGRAWPDLSSIVVYEGPGSFTGLRIGTSMANALAYGLDVPVTATAGEDWIASGIDALADQKPGKFVAPVYGSPAKTTTPRK